MANPLKVERYSFFILVTVGIELKDIKDNDLAMSNPNFTLTYDELLLLLKDAYRNGYATYEMTAAGLEPYDDDGYARWVLLGMEKNKLQMEVNASETQRYYKSKEVQDLDNPTDVIDEYESMESNKILASNKDKDIFFNELLNPSEPNKALKDAAAKYKTKHKHGFTRDEYMKLLENYPGINMERFWDALNGITCMTIDGESVVFHRDIELAIRCGMEDRSPTIQEWD